MKRSGIRRLAWGSAALAILVLVLNFGTLRPPRTPQDSVLQDDDSDDSCSGALIPAAYAADVSAPDAPAGGDIVPIRAISDPYPSLHSVAVDATNNFVVMSDSNRGNLLFYPRTSGSLPPAVTAPERQLRGPATGMMFIAGVALDPTHQEVFTVDNDIGDRMLVFPYGVEGNSKPRRVLFVPHGSWGLSLDPDRDEIAVSVEHINTVVVYRREASGAEAPLRVIHGPDTGLADPHGVAVDPRNHDIVVANHGNWAPLTRAEASQGGTLQGGHFQPPSITVYENKASGNTRPARTIEGARTELNWPMGITVDPVHNELAVASYGNNSILIFRATDTGDVAPIRVIHGDRAGVLGPMGVAIDAQNDELWVTNYRDHSAVVFARTADGNVAPRRIVRNAPVGTAAVGFGNPGAVAYDSKRDDILVPN